MNRWTWPILAAAIALGTLGVIFIHSAGSSLGAYGEAFAERQAMWLFLGGIVGVAVGALDYRLLPRLRWPIYALTLLALLLVLVAGASIKGSQRWIPLGPLHLQPSEPAKLGIIVVLAASLVYGPRHRTFRGLLHPLLVAAVPVALVLQQPDLGTALVFGPVILAMLFAAGTRLRHLLVLGSGTLAFIPFAWAFVFHDYQRRRFLAFLDPEAREYYLREGYQLIQSVIAVGAGGLAGKGYGGGTQTQLQFLPERHTDFVFAVIAEEWGLLGVLLVLGLYTLILWTAIEVAWRTREPFGRLCIVGISVLIATQVAVNTGMNVGLMPITGLTLPLVSYGGSSTLTFAAGLGLIIAIARRAEPELSDDGFDRGRSSVAGLG